MTNPTLMSLRGLNMALGGCLYTMQCHTSCTATQQAGLAVMEQLPDEYQRWNGAIQISCIQRTTGSQLRQLPKYSMPQNQPALENLQYVVVHS
jgi:hypothetical protein